MSTKLQLMKLSFQQQFNEELLQSEKKRTIILLATLLFGVLYQVINALFFNQPQEDQALSFRATWIFPALIILFELGYLIYIRIRFKGTDKHIPLIARYFIVATELLLLSGIMLHVAKQYPRINVLESPAVFVYFVFIILCTLRLNFGLSLFSGILAAASYLFIGLFIYDHFLLTDSIKVILILSCGTASGLVATQIKKGINFSLEQVEKRTRIANLFSQQISKEIADKMIDNEGELKSKRMNVAILFIDIRDFTSLTSEKTPEEIVRYQNAFFTIVIDTITRHGGIVNQILGDGCMVTFGAPIRSDNPSAPAVNAAKELLANLEKAIQSGSLPDTRIGMGIHTGEAVTGNIGNEERQQYSITGSVVILACRIEQLNKELNSQLLVSENVLHLAGKNMHHEFIGDMHLKGWPDPVTIYKLA
jgi:adenylate cyclase